MAGMAGIAVVPAAIAVLALPADWLSRQGGTTAALPTNETGSREWSQ